MTTQRFINFLSSSLLGFQYIADPYCWKLNAATGEYTCSMMNLSYNNVGIELDTYMCLETNQNT